MIVESSQHHLAYTFDFPSVRQLLHRFGKDHRGGKAIPTSRKRRDASARLPGELA